MGVHMADILYSHCKTIYKNKKNVIVVCWLSHQNRANLKI
jgi:hypothetical protein